MFFIRTKTHPPTQVRTFFVVVGLTRLGFAANGITWPLFLGYDYIIIDKLQIIMSSLREGTTSHSTTSDILPGCLTMSLD